MNKLCKTNSLKATYRKPLAHSKENLNVNLETRQPAGKFALSCTVWYCGRTTRDSILYLDTFRNVHMILASGLVCKCLCFRDAHWFHPLLSSLPTSGYPSKCLTSTNLAKPPLLIASIPMSLQNYVTHWLNGAYFVSVTYLQDSVHNALYDYIGWFPWGCMNLTSECPLACP